MKRIFQRFAVFVTAFSLVLTAVPVSVPAQAAFDFASQSSGVIKISVFEDNVGGDYSVIGQGTGFYINDEIAITAAHVVLVPSADEVSEAAPYIVVERENPANEDDPLRSFARVIAVDAANDVAMLHVFPAPFDAPSKKVEHWNHHSFSLASEEQGVGSRVNIIGYPDIGNTEMTLTTGIISSEEKNNGNSVFTSDAVVSNGNSGGPAINENGEVIGVVSAVQFSQSNNSQLTRIVSLPDLSQWVDVHKNTRSDYQYSQSFYERFDAAFASEVAPSSVDRTITVSNPFYPEFSFTLPANHYTRVSGPNGGYYVFDGNDDNVLYLGFIASPIIIDQDVLADNLETIFGLDLVEDSDTNVTISTKPGIQFKGVGSSSDSYAVSMEDWIFVAGVHSNNKILESLRFGEIVDNRADFTTYDDHLQGLRLEAPSGYYIHDLSYSTYIMYHPNALADAAFSARLVNEPFDSFVANGPNDIENEPNVETTFNTLGTSKFGGKTAITKGVIAGFIPFAVGALEDISRNRVMYVEGLSNDEHATFSEVDHIIGQSRFGMTFSNPMVNVLELLIATDTNQQTLPPRLRTVSSEPSTEPDVKTEEPVVISNPESILEGQARDDLLGYILLQVEAHGEAWYIEPQSRERIYMKDGKAAFEVMRKYGLGITNADLAKISIGSDPKDSGACSSFAKSLSGKVLLQVDENGEAWYIYPKNCRRYSLGRPDEAYDIMRFLGLGALNKDIEAIREQAL